jgi:hypothetical protein
MSKLTVVIVLLSVSSISTAQPVSHQFSVWGINADPAFKTGLYIGWLNGLFIAKRESDEGFISCLETIPYSQAVSMVDKHYKDHPERWSRSFGSEMINALTIRGGPCEKKGQLSPSSN